MKILDLTAGKRGIWFDKKNPSVTFVDIRQDVKPDIIADSRALPCNIGIDYDLVVFDPPHVNVGANSNMAKDYGHLTTEQIREFVSAASKEAHRVSKTSALMAFKWNDHDKNLTSVLDLMAKWWTPLFGQRTARTARSSTYWVLMERRSGQDG